MGGSGQLNYLVHSFGIPDDYKDWPPGWSYDDLHPYFQQVETIMGIPGVLLAGPLVDAFMEIDQSDLTGNVTIEKGQNTIRRGGRWSTYHAYLQNAWNRKNLHILPDTLVTKILFDDKSTTVEGIQIRHNNEKLKRIDVINELIICAGAVNTPQLLMLSGIGPFDQLRQNQVSLTINYLVIINTKLFHF